MSALAPMVESFFTDYLMKQRAASGHTVAAYRDAFRLLFSFMQQEIGTPPAALARAVGRFADRRLPRTP